MEVLPRKSGLNNSAECPSHGNRPRYDCEIIPDPMRKRSISARTPTEAMGALVRKANAREMGRVSIRISDRRTYAQIAVTLDANGACGEVRHLNHPEPDKETESELEAGYMALTATEELIRRFTGRWHDTDWKPFPRGPRRNRGAERLWRTYKKLHQGRLLKWCALMKERDKKADRTVDEFADALEKRGWDVLVMYVCEMDEQSDILTMIERIENAEDGEDIARALSPQMTVHDPR